jgi:hypothetical protein
MISTAHPLMIVNRAADIHYVLLMFPSMVEHRSGVDSPQRENGCEHLVLMFLFVAREITCCPPPASMAVGDSRICSPIWCLYCTDWRLRQIVLACTNYIQCMLGVVEERYAGGCTCLFFFQANFGMIQLMFFLGWSCETIS